MIKKYLKYQWISENLTTIVLVPTLIGGIWQILELLLIGTAYIRFFSISQVVPDGLLILIILTLSIIVSKIILNDAKDASPETVIGKTATDLEETPIANTSNESNNDISENNEIKNKSILMEYLELSLSVGVLTIFLGFTGKIFFDQDFLDQFPLIALLMAIFLALITVTVVFYTFKAILRIHEIKINLGNDRLLESIKMIFMIVVPAVFFGSLFFLSWFHNSFLLSKDMRNAKALDYNIRQQNRDMKNYKVLYFNDKYIFVRITPSKGQSGIDVYEFSAFFGKDESPRQESQ